MSLIVVVYVREGIVMASDSRLTLNTRESVGPNQTNLLAVGQTDSVHKTFLTSKRVGISTYGDADIDGVPISGYVESFINDHLKSEDDVVDMVPHQILEYFGKLPKTPNSHFLVAGYKLVGKLHEQQVWEVNLAAKSAKQTNPPGNQGARWGGEIDVLSRLLQPVGTQDASKGFQPFPHWQMPWGFFTLQDAIDVAEFAIRVTSDVIRFLPRPKTVGGPIDILVIKPTSADWIQRKSLHA